MVYYVCQKTGLLLVRRVLNGVHTSQDFLHFTVELDKVVSYHRICFLFAQIPFLTKLKNASLAAKCKLKFYCMSVFMYADNILILAPSVSCLQHLLRICEEELIWLDMSINVKKSACIRVGPRYKHVCSNLVTSDGGVISWVDKLRYLGVNLLSAKAFSCTFENAKKSFYSAFDNIIGKVGQVATENVVIELLKKKCLPGLLYGLEVCPHSSPHLKSINYAVVSSFKKIFNVSSTETAKECMFMFGCQDISIMIKKKKENFLQKLALSSSVTWTVCQEFVSKDLSYIA